MNEREDVWLPAPSTMQDWARSVDNYLKAKHQLDRQRAQQAKQATGGQDR